MKKIMSVFLSLCIMCTMLVGISVSAAAATTSGTTGDCKWSLNGTALTISGNGAMADYDCVFGDTAPWGTKSQVSLSKMA